MKGGDNPAAGDRQRSSALLTDLYQLTMMRGYLSRGRHRQRVCFEYYFRSLPNNCGFAVFAGLEAVLDYLENLRFEPDDIEYLRGLNLFDEPFLKWLEKFECKLDCWAAPEGTPVFPNEPLLRIEGPIIQAQLVETFLLNALNYQTLIATKAARVCLAADGDPVLEFGLRRAQGPDGALSGSRAAYIGGCAATSNVLAGMEFGIPVRGTHAHSWVMSFKEEIDAFRAYAETYPENTVLLVDTYDTLRSGVPNAIAVFREMRRKNPNIRPAIRLDSGDLALLSKKAHDMFRKAGFEDPLIIASNDLDEDLIADLKRQGARINAWGVGTRLIVSWDHPALGGVYKLAAVQAKNKNWTPKIKISSNLSKTTNPGRKQIYRCFSRTGAPLGDVLALAEETRLMRGHSVDAVDMDHPERRCQFQRVARFEPLLAVVLKDGRRVAPAEALPAIRARAQAAIAALPEEYKRLRNPEIFPVRLTPKLGELKQRFLAPRRVQRHSVRTICP